jgi:uncharacterized protein with FMN-binding domain
VAELLRGKKKMKYHPLIRFIVATMLCGLLFGCHAAPITGGDLEGKKLIDGVYEGSSRNGPNIAAVKVTIDEGRITDVKLVRHMASWKGKRADILIPQRIMAEQSTRVDVVSGATNSSIVIMNAVQEALEKAYE